MLLICYMQEIGVLSTVCKLLKVVTLHATCLTLAAMTIDRYHAIVNPIDSMNWRTPKVSLFISIVSLSVSIPFLVYTSQIVDEVGDYQCSENWPSLIVNKVATLIVILSTYVLPLTVIVLCYARILHHLWRGMKHTRVPTSENEANGTVPLRSAAQLRRKRRVTRMVAAVILLFAIFWLPIHVINMWYKWDPYFPKSEVLLMFKIFSHTLSYANSCVNPFVYAFLNDGFRKAFRKRCPRLGKLFGCVKKAKSDAATSMIDKAVEARPGMEETHTEFSTQVTSFA
ncbi:hypothetical protein KUTeg_009296 [Tegillarca granosa]|uniref:G-protein coupled receptors family 1 profile domain-containing protein n=1 Tax=Tegillarca granosa TaxID=220873 RepID=A0ABQ9FBC9_TEGGR|nr:hypothetical protein KUTeg_009296 [Tegillarca granosa]